MVVTFKHAVEGIMIIKIVKPRNSILYQTYYFIIKLSKTFLILSNVMTYVIAAHGLFHLIILLIGYYQK